MYSLMDFDKCIRHVTNTTIKIHITSITPERSSCPFAVSCFPSPLAPRNHWSAFLSHTMGFSRIWPASDMVFWAAVFHFQLPDTHIPSLDLASLMRPISPAMRPRSRKVCGMGWHRVMRVKKQVQAEGVLLCVRGLIKTNQSFHVLIF